MLDSRKETQARSSGGERYPDTVEVASSNLAVPTLLEHTGGAHWGKTFNLDELFPLRQNLFAKNVLMTAQRNFCLGNSLSRFDHWWKASG